VPLSHRSTVPWYRQFWPWFLIALPATAVVAGLTTVYIAFNNADTLVKDNYYKEGLAINARLDQDRLAEEMNLSAKIVIDELSGEVLVELSGVAVRYDNLQLLLIHPVDQARDMTIDLIPVGEGRYRADLGAKPQNRYYLRLQPSGSGDPGRSEQMAAKMPQWRLNGEIDLDRFRQVLLESGSANS
jgi:hypothetical protein